jgi:beta-lactamase class A
VKLSRLTRSVRLGLAAAFGLAASFGSAAPARAAATCVSPDRPPGASSAAASALQDRIEAIVARAPSGQWSVYVQRLETGESASVDGDQLQHPASSIKIGIAVDLLTWLEQHPRVKLSNGPPGQTRSYEQLLTAMIVKSEEGATATLTNFLNGQPGFGLNRQLRAWGARCSSVNPRRATAADLAWLLERLYRGELLSPDSTTLLLNLLRTPSPDDIARLGRGLPPALRPALAHKTGTLFQDQLGVVADVGVLPTSAGTYVVAVVGNGVAWVDYYRAMRLIADISRAAYEAFGPAAAACPLDSQFGYSGLGFAPC